MSTQSFSNSAPIEQFSGVATWVIAPNTPEAPHSPDNLVSKLSATEQKLLSDAGWTNLYVPVVHSATYKDNPSSLYPSVINVTGIVQPVKNVLVTIKGFTNEWAGCVDFLIVNPQGIAVELSTGAGGATPVNNVTLTFDSTSSNVLPPPGNQIVSGTYKPKSYYPNTPYPAPAPKLPPGRFWGTIPYSTNLGVFNNANVNGDWALFVCGSHATNGGIINNGWEITFIN